jgi:tetratricopeptide (TPR) repeat protein
MARARGGGRQLRFHQCRRIYSDPGILWSRVIPGSPAQALLAQGRYHFWTGNTGEAITIIKEAIHRQGNFPEAYCALGLAYEELKRHLEALGCFQVALIFRPSYAAAQSNLGIVFSKLGHQQAAEEACQSAVRMAPENFMTHSALGAVLFNAGNYEKAVESFSQVTRIKPEYGNGHLDLGLTYLRLGDWSSARKEYAALQRLDPPLAALLQTWLEIELDPEAAYPGAAGRGSGMP